MKKTQEREGMFKKASSARPQAPLARGAYDTVREHDKGPRTPLADFFNTPSSSETKDVPRCGN